MIYNPVAPKYTDRLPIVACSRQKSRSLAVSKVDAALALIASGPTLHEGIYAACRESLLGLEKLEALPLAVRLAVVDLLHVLVAEPDPDGDNQSQLMLTSLSEGEAMQFVERLRHLLQQLHDPSTWPGAPIFE